MLSKIKWSTAVLFAVFVSATSVAQEKTNWQIKPVDIQTRWAKNVSPKNVLPEYPRPQFVRTNWQNLNGLWQYAITGKDISRPSNFDGQILVPYPIESALSGVQKALQPAQRLWYRRSINKPVTKNGDRILLHFGAVDWEAHVFINGKEVGSHQGGYQNFSFDVTEELNDDDNTLEVSVLDPSDKGINPYGKQVLNPRNIMYTASSGIWQTVWMETVPANYIKGLKITPDVDKGILALSVISDISPERREGYTVEAIAYDGKKEVSRSSLPLGEMAKAEGDITIPNAKLWSPDSPFLYDLVVRLKRDGKFIDEVKSYFGMRKIEVKKDDKGIERLFLNNKYTFHLGVLDQGFWPEGLYTAPTDEALKFDITAIKNMGYNTIRKHIKLEPARWYYHADKVGMLVWQDMVTCANATKEAQEQFEKENKENIAQLYNTPSIVTWVLFNEGWGRYDQKHLTEWMKNEDPTRIINGHSGENYDKGSPADVSEKWASSNLTDIHVYPGPGIPDALPGKARVLGEWGGVWVPTPKHQWNDLEGWGYIQVSASKFKLKYDSLITTLSKLEKEGLSGSIYTEPFDVETEENGIMSYDRAVIKIAPNELRKIHSKILKQAESYAVGKNIFSAKLTDTTNRDLIYEALLDQFNQGKREPDFLRELAIMASRLKDEKSASLVSAAYINIMKDPLTLRNLKFINKFTKTSKDPGFEFFKKNLKQADELLGFNRATGKLQGIIYDEEIKPYWELPMDKVDWGMIKDHVMAKCPNPGEELYLRTKAVYYANHNSWDNLLHAGREWVQKCEDTASDYILNEIAWKVFEKVEDRTLLEEALNWSRLAIRDMPNAEKIDTYANLLYKLGRKDEAVRWQSKAVELKPEDEGIAFTLSKMRKGERTW